jgi:flagellar biosynthesis chaperone FliJ
MKTATSKEKDIQSEIMSLLEDIETNYPELYQNLEEMAMINPKSSGVTIEQYASYLDFLTTQLKHHIENNRKR